MEGWTLTHPYVYRSLTVVVKLLTLSAASALSWHPVTPTPCSPGPAALLLQLRVLAGSMPGALQLPSLLALISTAADSGARPRLASDRTERAFVGVAQPLEEG